MNQAVTWLNPLKTSTNPFSSIYSFLQVLLDVDWAIASRPDLFIFLFFFFLLVFQLKGFQ